MTSKRTPAATIRRPLLLIHIVASVGLLGAVAVGVMLAVTAAGGAVDSDAAYELMSLQAAIFGIPLSFVSLATGVALGRVTKWGVVAYRWTAAKLALQIAVIANGALVLGPTVGGLRDGDSPWGLGAGGLVVAEAASGAMLLAAVALSVYKPWGRTRRGGRSPEGRRGPSSALRGSA